MTARDLEARHSALEEFARDERRPAVLLLAALVIAAIFFALGIIFDRWTINRSAAFVTPPAQSSNATHGNGR